jgi:hypothetical protein
VVPTGRKARAVIVGLSDGALWLLLTDVLLDEGVAIARDEDEPGPDVVFAFVGFDDVVAVLTQARATAGLAPVIAILPLDDERLSRQAKACGANAVYALNHSLQHLRRVLAAVLSESAASGPRVA